MKRDFNNKEDKEKPYKSGDDWYDQIKHLVKPSVVIIIILLLFFIVISLIFKL